MNPPVRDKNPGASGVRAMRRRVQWTAIWLWAFCWLAVARAAVSPEAAPLPETPTNALSASSAELRPMTTDGFAATETPYTVDAGHFQIELTLVQYAREQDRVAGESYRRESWLIAPLILKLGLHESIDVEVVLEPWQIVRERFGTNTVEHRGFGNTTLRFKANVWGNDEGRSAFAVMPYWTFPTSSRELGPSRLEGGFSFPLSVNLVRHFYFDVTPKIGEVWDADAEQYQAAYSVAVSLGCVVWRDAYIYVEWFGSGQQHHSEQVSTFDTGLSYALTDDLQVSAGIQIGLTRAAEDWSPFVGIAWRY